MNNELRGNIETINRHSDFLRETYNVKSIGIFGSVVRGKNRRKSDIDILIELSKPIDFFEFIELENYLSKILKKKVDLVTKKALKPAIKKNVLKEVVYA